MHFPLSIFIILIFCIASIRAQPAYLNDVKSAAVGFTGTTLTHPSSFLSNPAGLAQVTSLKLFTGYRNHFNFDGLNSKFFGLIWPTSLVNIGITVDHLGDHLYNQQNIGLTLANQLGITSLGIRVNLSQIQFSGFGSKRLVEIDFGGIAEITKEFFVGASISNLNQASISKSDKEYRPTIMSAGISYRPTSKVYINLEAAKDVDHATSYKAGIQYAVHKSLWIGMGIVTEPRINTFGLGFIYRKFEIDYAMLIHPALGNSHLMSVAYRIKNKS